MNALIPDAFAQAGASGPAGGIAPLLMMVVFIVIFYFLLIRPQQKKMKDHRAMVAALKRGDKVVTNGGIFGTVTHVGDDHLMVEIADGVKIKIARDAVSAVPAKPEPVKKEEAKS